jgi:hypothetical protein
LALERSDKHLEWRQGRPPTLRRQQHFVRVEAALAPVANAIVFLLLKAISSWSAHVRARIARCGFTIGPKLTIGVGAVWLSAAIAQK